MINLSTTNQEIEQSIDYVEEFGDKFEPLLPPYTNRGGINTESAISSHSALTLPTFGIVIIDYLTVVFNIDDLHSIRKVVRPDGIYQDVGDEVLQLIIKLRDFVPDLAAD